MPRGRQRGRKGQLRRRRAATRLAAPHARQCGCPALRGWCTQDPRPRAADLCRTRLPGPRAARSAAPTLLPPARRRPPGRRLVQAAAPMCCAHATGAPGCRSARWLGFIGDEADLESRARGVGQSGGASAVGNEGDLAAGLDRLGRVSQRQSFSECSLSRPCCCRQARQSHALGSGGAAPPAAPRQRRGMLCFA